MVKGCRTVVVCIDIVRFPFFVDKPIPIQRLFLTLANILLNSYFLRFIDKLICF